jgi:soluble lytic murein transglycosylase-like protein
VGAWDQYRAADGSFTRYYRRTRPVTVFPSDHRHAYGCRAVKRALTAQGFVVAKMDSEKPVIGSQAEEAIRAFQRSKKLTVDGIVGPQSARALFDHYIRIAEKDQGIPDRLACRKLALESNFDPACLGADGSDKGIAQINEVHKLAPEQVFEPAFAIPWAARYLRGHYDALRDWDAALASYNMGRGAAREWQGAGKPATGGRTIKVGGKEYGLYEWATLYVRAVRSRPC